MGLCPQSVEDGDEVVVMLGCTSPLILRLEGNSQTHYKIIRERYILGITFAELLYP
jgi:hypothetical protein